MEGLQTFCLFHEIGIGQDDEVHIADAVKVLVVDLAKSLGRMKTATIEGHKLITAVAKHLEIEGRTVELSLYEGGIRGIAHIPNLCQL